jgi:predicted transcriptional regulator
MSQTYVFNDPFLQREDIFNNTKNISGCYIWLNRINSKCYIGSSVNLATRLKFYYSYNTHKINYSSLIISALLRYGMNNFSLIVITIPNSTTKEVLKLEQILIDNYNSEYNILRIAGSRTGHKYSTESKALMSKNTFNFYNSESQLKTNGLISVYSVDKELLNQYVSIREAAKELNISGWSISKYIKSEQLFNNQFYFSYNLLKDSDNINKVIISNKSTKPLNIYVYSSDFELLYNFNSVSESARKLEIPRTTISTYLDTRKVLKANNNSYLFFSCKLNDE